LTSAVITGCESMERLNQAFAAAHSFQPLSQAAISKLLAKTAQAAMTGQYEPFKTTAQIRWNRAPSRVDEIKEPALALRH